MMWPNFNLTIVAIVAAILAGCGAAPIKSVSSPESAAAYGNITLPNGVITNVMLYKVGEVYAPPFKSPPKSHTYTNGNFFFENLEPGRYFLMGFMSGNEAFYFNFRGMSDEEFIHEVAVDIKPGSVIYLGSYEVTGIDRKLFRSDTFEIKRSEMLSKKTILMHLKEAAAGTGWDERFGSAISGK